MNKLFYGDNLDILQRYIQDESIDLIYLDPPFNSNATYNVLFGTRNGKDAAAQIKAFDDTWHWDQVAAESFREVVEEGGDVSRAMQAFRLFLSESDMLAYLSMMAPRLVEMKRVLKPTGNIFLHCDPTASHYLKILLDAIFSPKHFINEIIWCYSHGGRSSKRFGRKHDVIFWYSKTDDYTFNSDNIRIPMKSGKSSFGGRIETDEDGRKYRLVYGTKNKKGETRYYKYYLDRGKIPEDYWTDINSLQSNVAERLGYPTQKPEELLERIVKSCSNEGDLVLDPFCGCGTTVAVTQKLNRKWIGIDITHLAINLMKHRLQDTFGSDVKYDVIGEPVSLEGAQTLAKEDPYQFQWWALGLVAARPSEEKKGADAGIDGRLYFHDDPKGDTKQVIISVKAGKPHLSYMRDLRGVIDREQAEIGVLITMQDPTKPMRSEAASGGFYESPWGGNYPKLQILTIEDLLKGGKIDMPPIRQVNQTYRRAPRHQSREGDQPSLLKD